MDNLIIYGGTFDPIHLGHIKTALNVQQHFNFQRFIFLPCKIPLLKMNAHASADQRVEMLNLVLKNYSFEVDTREIMRETPSYMVTTLSDFRKELGSDISITLLMGMDTFANLPRWHQWPQLLTLANLVVIDRPDSTSLSMDLQNLLVNHETRECKEILSHSHGLIYRFNAGMYDYSSTMVRQQLALNQAPNALPTELIAYIKAHHLYTAPSNQKI